MKPMNRMSKVSLRPLCWLLALVSLAGCEHQNHYVIAASATVIGVELSQNPATQTPQAKLGYNRAELAIVPSNRTNDPNVTEPKGAQEVPDVLMELRYDGIFSTNAGIYQRLAVGSNAVEQPGATALLVRNT